MNFSKQNLKKKSTKQKKVFIFQGMELSSSNIEKNLVFSCISGNGNLEKIFLILEETGTLK